MTQFWLIVLLAILVLIFGFVNKKTRIVAFVTVAVLLAIIGFLSAWYLVTFPDKNHAAIEASDRKPSNKYPTFVMVEEAGEWKIANLL